MTITWQTVITASAVAAAVIALYKLFASFVTFIERQKAQDSEIKAIKEEQTLIVYGLLSCLKGLAEQGCDGPVHEAIDKIEKHLNIEAHK